MNLNYFRTLIAVIEAGSFSAAARQLGLTQPAVSMHIQALEDYFGTKLLDRGGKGLELTRAGELAAQNITRLLEGVDSTRRQIDEMIGDVAGPVLIGASTVPGEHLAPGLISVFSQKHPRVKPRLLVGSTATIADKLARKEVDLGIVGAQPKDPLVRTEPLYEDELVLLVHPAHRFASRYEVPAEEIYSEPFIGRTSGSGSKLVYERELAGCGISTSRINYVIEVGTSLAAVNAVEARLGVAVVSVYAAEKSLRLGSVKGVRLSNVRLTRPFYLITMPQRYGGRAVSEMASFLRSAEARAYVEGRRKAWTLS